MRLGLWLDKGTFRLPEPARPGATPVALDEALLDALLDEVARSVRRFRTRPEPSRTDDCA